MCKFEKFPYILAEPQLYTLPARPRSSKPRQPDSRQALATPKYALMQLMAIINHKIHSVDYATRKTRYSSHGKVIKTGQDETTWAYIEARLVLGNLLPECAQIMGVSLKTIQRYFKQLETMTLKYEKPPQKPEDYPIIQCQNSSWHNAPTTVLTMTIPDWRYMEPVNPKYKQFIKLPHCLTNGAIKFKHSTTFGLLVYFMKVCREDKAFTSRFITQKHIQNQLMITDHQYSNSLSELKTLGIIESSRGSRIGCQFILQPVENWSSGRTNLDYQKDKSGLSDWTNLDYQKDKSGLSDWTNLQYQKDKSAVPNGGHLDKSAVSGIPYIKDKQHAIHSESMLAANFTEKENLEKEREESVEGEGRAGGMEEKATWPTSPIDACSNNLQTDVQSNSSPKEDTDLKEHNPSHTSYSTAQSQLMPNDIISRLIEEKTRKYGSTDTNTPEPPTQNVDGPREGESRADYAKRRFQEKNGLTPVNTDSDSAKASDSAKPAHWSAVLALARDMAIPSQEAQPRVLED